MTDDKRTVLIEGERYPLVPYGDEVDWDDVPFFTKPCHVCGVQPGDDHKKTCALGPGRPYVRLPHCRDCGVPIGHIHVLTCGIEQCPRCSHQYMACPCRGEEDEPEDE